MSEQNKSVNEELASSSLQSQNVPDVEYTTATNGGMLYLNELVLLSERAEGRPLFVQDVL